MQQTNFANNQAQITGKICSEFEFSHEVYGEKFYNFKLFVSRLSGTADILPMTASQHLIRDEFCPDANVTVVGQVRSYNSFSAEQNKNKLILTLFVHEMALADEEPDGQNPNSVQLNGFICKQPIYRVTPFKREITDLLIAVNRSYSKSDYIPCIAWGKYAKFSGELAVGTNVVINGRMQSRIYQKKLEDGKILEKTAYEVSVSFLEVWKEDPGDIGK